jgi:hypothetical protein
MKEKRAVSALIAILSVAVLVLAFVVFQPHAELGAAGSERNGGSVNPTSEEQAARQQLELAREEREGRIQREQEADRERVRREREAQAPGPLQPEAHPRQDPRRQEPPPSSQRGRSHGDAPGL